MSQGTYLVMIKPDTDAFKGIGKDISKKIKQGLEIGDIDLDGKKIAEQFQTQFDKGLGNNQRGVAGFGTSFANSVISNITVSLVRAASQLASLFTTQLFSGIVSLSTAPAQFAFDSFVGVAQGAFDVIVNSAKVAGVAIAAGLTATVVSSFQQGSQLEQNLGGIEAVFRNSSDSIKEWSATTATASGFSMNQALSNATMIGQILQATGINEGEANELTKQLLQRASDAASVLGTDVSQAIANLTSGLKGNIEVLDNIGAPLTAAALGEYALAQGIQESTTQMSQQTKTALIAQYILDKTSNFAGNFAKESLTLSGSLSILKASWETLTGSFQTGDSNLISASIQGMLSGLDNFAESLSINIPTIFAGIATGITNILPSLVDNSINVLTIFVESFEGILLALFNASSSGDLPRKIFESLNNVIAKGISFISNPENLKIMFNPLFDGLEEGILGFATNITGFANIFSSTIAPVFSSFLSGIAPLVGSIGGQLFRIMIDVFGALIPSIAPLLSTFLPQVISSLITFYRSIADVLLPSLLQILPDLIPELINFVTVVASEMAVLIPQFVDVILSIFSSSENKALLKTLVDVVNEVMNAMFMAFFDIINSPQISAELAYLGVSIMRGFAQGIALAARTIFGPGILDIIYFIIKLFTDGFDINSPSRVAMGWGTNIIAGFLIGIQENVAKVFSFIGGFITNIFNFFGSIGQSMFGIGANIVSGIINGVASMLDTLWRILSSVANGILGVFTFALDINSPSKVMADVVGKNIILGISEGMTTWQDELKKPAASTTALLERELSGITAIGDSILDNGIVGAQIINNTFEVQPVDSIPERQRAIRKAATAGITALDRF